MIQKLKNIKSSFIAQLKIENRPDYHLFFTASILIIIGVIFSYSLSIYTVVHLDYDQFHFFKRQLFAAIVSILIMWSFAHIRPDKLLMLLGWGLFGVFAILVLTMPYLPSSYVTQSGGASRWIRAPGFSISPVEFFKIGFAYFLANSFTRQLIEHKKLSFKDELIKVSPYIIIFALFAYFIAIKQKDLGQTMVLALIGFFMLMFANRSWKLLSLFIVLSIFAVAALVVTFAHRIDRIQSWWGMVQDDLIPLLPDFLEKYLRIEQYTEPYQVGHSLNAINNGGLWGEGIANGYIKLGFLSEVHTDFVLAGITEELGFFGLLAIVILFTFMIVRIFKISRRTTNKKYHLFAIGIAVMLGSAFWINGFGTSGLIPIKGLAVPLLSYGGSSLVATSLALGLVLSISNSKKELQDNI